VVSADGVQPDPEKLACIRDWPPPRTVRQVRSFMGLASYYRKHVPQFATLATPLTDLERATTRFVWGPVQQTAFDTLKTELCSARVLQPPQGESLLWWTWMRVSRGWAQCSRKKMRTAR
jgi:hypothetical protein